MCSTIGFIDPSAHAADRRVWEQEPRDVTNDERLRATVRVAVAAEDGRGGTHVLDECGFTFTDVAPMAWAECCDEAAMRQKHYPKLQEVACRLIGCTTAAVVEHITRGPQGVEGRQTSYAKFAHNDINRAGCIRPTKQEMAQGKFHNPPPTELLAGLTGADAGALRGWRVVWLTLWQPADRAVEDHPLGVCDWRSVDAADVLQYRLRSKPHWPPHEQLALRYSAGQRWVYFPRMRPGEAIVMKQYDSAADCVPSRGVAWGCFHAPLCGGDGGGADCCARANGRDTAAAPPPPPPADGGDAPTRLSVEARVLCGFAPPPPPSGPPVARHPPADTAPAAL